MNNYSDEEYEELLAQLPYSYLIIGKEVGKENTPHLQGYVRFDSAKTLGSLKPICTRVHWETCKGSHEQNIAYCKKDDAWTEWGDPKIRQGKRSDIDHIKDMIKTGSNLKDVYDECSSYQAIRMAEIGLRLFSPKREWKTDVIWYWGPTGSGKTRTAIELFNGQNYWISGRDLQWWDGYEAHENVIFDEFRADFCKFHELLRILDRYPYTVAIKGGTRQLLAKTIVITSCFPPQLVYPNKKDDADSIAQLMRRIDLVIKLGTPECTAAPPTAATETPARSSDISLHKRSDLTVLRTPSATAAAPDPTGPPPCTSTCTRTEVGGNTMCTSVHRPPMRTTQCDQWPCSNVCACNFFLQDEETKLTDQDLYDLGFESTLEFLGYVPKH